MQSVEAKEALRAKQEEAKGEHLRIKAAYERLFKTPNGKIVLADLRRQYMDTAILDLKHGPEATIARAAAHDVVENIIKMSKPLPETD